MVIVPAGGMLLEESAHCSRAQVLIDLGVAVQEALGHLIVYSTAKPTIRNIDCKTTFRPF